MRLNRFGFLFLVLLIFVKHMARQHTGLSESWVPNPSQ